MRFVERKTHRTPPDLSTWARETATDDLKDTSATNQGTDWRDHDPDVETSVEIYQGTRQSYEQPGGPRSNNEKDSISGYQPKGYVDFGSAERLSTGVRGEFDHVSAHMSFANVLTADLTREALLDGFRNAICMRPRITSSRNSVRAITSWATRFPLRQCQYSA